MIVFDDSTPTNVEKYFTHLDQVKTHSDLFYVDPAKKKNSSPTSTPAYEIRDSSL
jgi:hypothetical protein